MKRLAAALAAFLLAATAAAGPGADRVSGNFGNDLHGSNIGFQVEQWW